MSPELRVLRNPSAAFQELAASPESGAWTLVRRPLLIMFAMGLLLSLGSSTRVSARTVVDGMISFAFLPVAEVLAAGAIHLRSDRHVPFVQVVDLFLVSHAPWLIWILGFCAWQAAGVSPTTMSDTTARLLVASLLVPAGWAAYLDLQLFRIVLSRRNVAVDLIVARLIGWTIAIGYFLGIALWAQIVAWLR